MTDTDRRPEPSDETTGRLRSGVVAGAAAGVLSLLALAARSRLETGSAAAGPNAPSHVLWGDAALERDDWTLRHTALGTGIHLGSAIFWGCVHAARSPSPRHPWREAAATTALAAFVDFALVPDRLTPGFERRLGPAGLAWVYGSFLAGLAWGSVASSSGDGEPVPRTPRAQA